MPFPETPRVIYRNNPLDQVICQLRFPAILRIDTEVPANFQERIRGDFPNFVETSEIMFELPQQGTQQIPAEIVGQAIKSTAIKKYTFASEDEVWKVNLTRTFLAITTTAYRRWEEFQTKLQAPFDALMESYAPASFSRLGLRYVDVIKRSRLGLGETPWRELIAPHVAGILGSTGVAESVKAFETTYNIGLGTDNDSVRIAMKLVATKESGEICFLIDSDFFNVGKTFPTDAMDKLTFLNKRASRLIRWAITDRLHQAMDPVDI